MEKIDDWDVVFLGGLFPKETENEIHKNSIGSVQFAANSLQWSIIKGLDSHLSKPVKILNSLYIGSFPLRYRKLIIETYRFNHCENTNSDLNIGFWNIPIIKNVIRYLTLKKHLKKWLKNRSNKKKIIIAYAMTSTFTHAIKYAKRQNREVITCLIVPDLPQYMNQSEVESVLYTIFKKIEIEIINKDLNYVDSYVLLTKHMQLALNCNKPFTVIEGISGEENINGKERITNKSTRSILYSGALVKKYGIIELLEAFNKIENIDYKLYLCGNGDAEETVRKFCLIDNRIEYLGVLKKEKVIELQQNVTLLVNPRPNTGEYVRYSFPSKILEYMSSGTATLSYKLEGIPEDYFKYMYTIEDNASLHSTLISILSKPDYELRDMGLAAKDYVQREKNATKQTGKIIDLLRNL